MAFTLITLKAGLGYRLATGAVPRARIRATPVVPMTNGTITVDQEVTVPLTSAGVATKTIQATTDPTTTPSGNAYRFVVEVDGRPVQQFIAALPHNAGTVVDISTLTPLSLPPTFTPPAVYSTEQAQDDAAALLISGAHSGISFLYDDSGNRVNATVTSVGGGSAGTRTTQVLAYVSTVILDAGVADIFRMTLTGDLLLSGVRGATDCQPIYLNLYADTATRTLSFAGGGASSVSIAAGSWWFGTFRYRAPADLLMLVEESTSAGGAPSPGGGGPGFGTAPFGTAPFGTAPFGG